ncbi:MAG: hypothetical protein EXS05_23420 [Planctomycetaceae bacterium]|nr:hypothetical protein [Planctomycetaceae bacterium]
MPSCPKCGCPLWFAEDECPDCRTQKLGDRAPRPALEAIATDPAEVEDAVAATDEWQVPIARFQNGAEAGYFCDELSRTTGVEVCVVVRERFDSVHAGWGMDYVLTAPAEQAPAAALALQKLVDESDDAGGPALESAALHRRELPVGKWIPLILTLAAGSIACWGVEQVVERPRARPGALVDRDPRIPPHLWHVLGGTPGPWIQKMPDGPGTRELSISARQQMTILREDGDGDGKFEREWRFDWRRE